MHISSPADHDPGVAGRAPRRALFLRSLRLLLIAAATLSATFIGTAVAAPIVYVNVPPNTISEDPLTVSDSAALGSASADLPSGVFSASTTSAPGVSDDATGGIRLYPTGALRFSNPGPGDVVIEAGAISARVRGTYTLTFAGAQFGGSSSAQCRGRLSARKGTTTHSVIATHQVTKTWNGSGELINSTNVFSPLPGSGTIVPVDTSLETLDMYLAQPGYVLAAAETLDLWFDVYSQSGTTVGEGASNCIGELSFLLAPGDTLVHDAGVPLGWVAPPPPVPTLGPLARVLWVSLLVFGALIAGRWGIGAAGLRMR